MIPCVTIDSIILYIAEKIFLLIQESERTDADKEKIYKIIKEKSADVIVVCPDIEYFAEMDYLEKCQI